VPELVGLVIRANLPIADRLGLDGRPAEPLSDRPVPPEPPAPH